MFLFPDHSLPLVKQLNSWNLVRCRFQGQSDLRFNLPNLLSLYEWTYWIIRIGCSEFDIAGLILYVGNTYLCSNKKKQWLFLTDGSKFISGQGCEEQDCLLAVSISSAPTDEDSALFSYTLSGNTVCDILILYICWVSVSYFESSRLNTSLGNLLLDIWRPFEVLTFVQL